MPGKSKATIWNAPFLSIFFANFVLQMGQFMMNTLVPRLADHLGGSSFVVGAVTSMFAITALAIRPISGPAMDCLSKKMLMLATSLVVAIAFFIYAFSDSIPLLIAGRLIHGIGMGVTAPLALSIATEFLPPDRISSGISYFSLGQAVGTAAGPGIGLALSRTLGYRPTFLIGAAVVILACVLMLFMPSVKRPEERKLRIIPSNIFAREALVPALILAFASLSYSCINYYITMYGDARGVTQIGLYFTAYAAVLIFSRPICGAIADRHGFASVMLPGFALFALSLLAISYSRSLAAFIVSGVVSAFGFGTLFPSAHAMGLKRVPAGHSGVAANTTYTGVDIGFLIGGPISGFVCGQAEKAGLSLVASYSVMYRVMIIPLALAAVIFIADSRRRKKLAAE